MELTLNQADLLTVLRTAVRAVSARNTIPILAGALLEALPGELRVRATDLELAVSTTVPASVSAPGTAVLPGRYLYDLVRRLPPGPIRLTLDQRSAVCRLEADDAVFALHGWPSEQFPAEPAFEGAGAMRLPAGGLRTLLRETGFAAGNDESRPWFTGVCLSVDGSLARAVATDGPTLAYGELTIENPADTAFSVIIPGRSVQELERLLGEQTTDSVEMLPVHNQLGFRIGGVAVATRLLEGHYPDVPRLLPTVYPSSVQLERGRFLEACERAALVARDGTARLVAGSQGLTLSARSAEVGSLEQRVGGVLEGPGFEIGLNVRYVLEGLRHQGAPSVLLEFSGLRSAVRFRSSTAARSFFAVMPLLQF